MRDTALHISLGHNSSALLAVDGVVVRGYEQERIDRKKNSSAYPMDAMEIATGSGVVDVAYVCHWFDHFDLDDLPTTARKYLDLNHLRARSPKIVTLTPEFTHHDAHAYSAMEFARGEGINGPACVIVADGFGNLQECLSVYELDGNLVRKHRTYGYKKSLGLMYQYATAFMNLKENQDEYKLLGYEAHILEYISKDQALSIQHRLAAQAEIHADFMLMHNEVPAAIEGELIDIAMLKSTRMAWYNQFTTWLDMFQKEIHNDRGIKVKLAFCVQTFLECVMMHLVWRLAPPGTRQFILTGGVFYNVKLSRRIQSLTGARVFTHPLAGDQGASLGMGDGPALLSLCIGERGWNRVPAPPGMLFASGDKWVEVASDYLSRNFIVNVVRGPMEFGPRALCNTSTLANPYPDNVLHINRLNERDDAMPMAPVMSRLAARTLLSEELEFVKGSDKYMITTVAWNGRPSQPMMGVVHKDPLTDVWTCRPQVISEHSDHDLMGLLESSTRQTLINTSFNYHGEPIVFTLDDAIRTHSMQTYRAHTSGIAPPVTIMVLET